MPVNTRLFYNGIRNFFLGCADYSEHVRIDCDHTLDLDEGWVLGGVHCHPTPHISIVAPSLPANGDHTLYLRALVARTKNKGGKWACAVPLYSYHCAGPRCPGDDPSSVQRPTPLCAGSSVLCRSLCGSDCVGVGPAPPLPPAETGCCEVSLPVCHLGNLCLSWIVDCVCVVNMGIL